MYEDILMGLLDCGSADLKMLEKCEYDFSDIRDILEEQGMDMSFQNILYACIDKYKSNLYDKIEYRIGEIEEEIKVLENESDWNNGNVSNEFSNKIKDLWEEKELLEKLNPYEDIESFINYLDTHIYITNDNSKVYKEYLMDIIEEEDYNIGFLELELV